MTTFPATQARELLTMSSVGVSSVEEYTSGIRKLLAKAQEVKPDRGLEPALITQDFEGGVEEIGKHNGAFNKEYAAIETACRNIFYALLVRLSKNGQSRSIADNPRQQHQLRNLRLVKYGIFSTSFPSSRI